MKIYKSKKSYSLILGILILFIIIDGFHIAGNNSTVNSILTLTIIHFVTLLFLIYIFFNTDYKIENNILIIRSAFMYKKNIKIDAIKSITKTNSLISAPAASITDRLELKYDKYKSVIISPKEKSEFIKELIRVNPSIKNNLKN